MDPCATGTGALKGLLEAEYAFGQAASNSVRAAFLEYLAEDSLVLEPKPTSGRAFYQSEAEHPGGLAWYPALADLADSDDLGFTTGPWVYTSAAGGESHGHFLSIWKRDAACQWRVEFDGGVSHAAPFTAEPKLEPAQVVAFARDAPSPRLIAEDAANRAILDFQQTVGQDGIAAGLRTYARTTEFLLYTDGSMPMGLAAANQQLTEHPILGDWQDTARGRSIDSTLAYSVGILNAARRRRYSYVQIWQYAPRVANWGLRILLLNPLSP
jgi:ketosteroid isomerase-like protein